MKYSSRTSLFLLQMPSEDVSLSCGACKLPIDRTAWYLLSLRWANTWNNYCRLSWERLVYGEIQRVQQGDNVPVSLSLSLSLPPSPSVSLCLSRFCRTVWAPRHASPGKTWNEINDRIKHDHNRVGHGLDPSMDWIGLVWFGWLWPRFLISNHWSTADAVSDELCFVKRLTISVLPRLSQHEK